MSGTRDPFIRPPFQETLLAKDTGEHTQAWANYHEEMSRQVQTLQAKAGVTDGSNAKPGQIGEYVTLTSTPVPLSSGVWFDCVTMPLTAGDWDVTGNVITVPAGGTTTSLVLAGITTTSLSMTPPAGGSYVHQSAAIAATQATALSMSRRISLAAPQNVYIVALVAFAAAGMQAYGFLGARRAR